MAITTQKQIDDALLGKITAAGLAIWIEDGVVRSTDDATVQAIVDAYTLAEAKLALSAKVALLAKTKRDGIVATISAGELASWPVKLAEASAYARTGDPADAPLLTIEATARGVTLADLMAKVAGNAQTFAALEAGIAGTDGRHRDAIAALPDWGALYAYDYTTGWPV